MSYNYLFKIVIIGDHNCGKSCILLRFAENTFRDDHVTTLGVDFKLKTIKLDRDRGAGADKCRLELWDTAGMERYRTIYNSYYHSAHAVMCVYDITDKSSFDNIRNYWLGEVRRHAPENAVVMLVGNKCDADELRTVDFTTAEKFAKENGISLFEVSAKSGINVEEAFLELARGMRERLLLSKMDHYYDSSDSDELAGGFHVDGVISAKSESRWPACCGGGTPKGTFV